MLLSFLSPRVAMPNISSVNLIVGANKDKRREFVYERLNGLEIGPQSPDLLSVFPTKGLIPIKSAREIIRFGSLSPFGERKAVIIWEAQYLSEEAQNALLKILEEPKERIYFFLTCPHPDLIAPTLSSRCAQIYVGAPFKKELSNFVHLIFSQPAPKRVGFWEIYRDYEKETLDGFLGEAESFFRANLWKEKTPKDALRKIWKARKTLYRSDPNPKILLENVLLNIV